MGRKRRERKTFSISALYYKRKGLKAYMETKCLDKNGIAECAKNYFELDPKGALFFASSFENVPNDVIRNICCKDATCAFLYAKEIDKGPTDATRNACSIKPLSAFDYALYIDKGPHDKTRDVCCTLPIYALKYAKYIDKGPHEKTRLSASSEPNLALEYAKTIDKCPTKETLKGVSKDNRCLYLYFSHFFPDRCRPKNKLSLWFYLLGYKYNLDIFNEYVYEEDYD